MRFIFILFSLYLFALANESKVCQKCHPIIYKEYYESSHRKASLVNNPIHKALWEEEKKHAKSYTCAACHSPSDVNSFNTTSFDEKSFAQKEEPISCVYCHSIKTIDEHEKANSIHLRDKPKEFYSKDVSKKSQKDVSYKKQSSFFGLITSNSGSPYHKIDYSNENYYNGNVCMGCHSHNKNSHNIDTFMLDAFIDTTSKETCVSCHMPKIAGSKVTINETKRHAYHAIAGIKKRVIDMDKYIEFKFTKNSKGFSIEVVNQANHALFGQMYRQGILHVEIIDGAKHTALAPYIFERILSDDRKKVLKDRLLYTKKTINYPITLTSTQKVKVSLFVKNISEKGLKSLHLDESVMNSKLMKTEMFH